MLSKKAFEVMVRPVVSARKNASARDIALQLMNGLYSGMPVTDDDGKVVGIITEIDLLKAIVEGKELEKTVASDIMTTEVISVNPDMNLSEIIKIMNEKKIIRVPVVSKEGKLRGVVSRCDILTPSLNFLPAIIPDSHSHLLHKHYPQIKNQLNRAKGDILLGTGLVERNE